MSPHTINHLPNEVLFKITAKLGLPDILQLHSTNQQFQDICHDNYFLRKLRPVPVEQFLTLLDENLSELQKSMLVKPSLISLVSIETSHPLVMFYMDVIAGEESEFLLTAVKKLLERLEGVFTADLIELLNAKPSTDQIKENVSGYFHACGRLLALMKGDIYFYYRKILGHYIFYQIDFRCWSLDVRARIKQFMVVKQHQLSSNMFRIHAYIAREDFPNLDKRNWMDCWSQTTQVDLNIEIDDIDYILTLLQRTKCDIFHMERLVTLIRAGLKFDSKDYYKSSCGIISKLYASHMVQMSYDFKIGQQHCKNCGVCPQPILFRARPLLSSPPNSL